MLPEMLKPAPLIIIAPAEFIIDPFRSTMPEMIGAVPTEKPSVDDDVPIALDAMSERL